MLVLLVGVAGTACSPAADSASIEPASIEPASSSPSDGVAATARAPDSNPVPSTASTTTPSTTTASTTTVTTTTVAPTPESTTRPAGADGDAEATDGIDEPTFELGPDVVLDLDVTRFPVDDAGVGGGAPVTTAAPAVPGEAPPLPTGWAGFDASLDAALVRQGNTAASVAVLIGGDVVHQASFGVRDPAVGDEAAPEDRFRIASISKTITAIVAMQLVEDGVIGLDDPVGRLVADHTGGTAGGGSATLTLRQLLTHRSGFGKYDTAFFRGGAVDCPDAARQGLQRGASGGGYLYSNMNYCVVGLAIEALTGLSYEQAVYQNLLTPLGISGMRLAPTFDPGPDETQHVSTPGRNYMETLGAAGAWIATPTDLVTIMDSLDVSTPGFKPLEAETVLQMVTPFGGMFGQRGYGYGLISYGAGRVGHTGTIESTHAMLLNRGDGVTWAVTVAGQIPSESTAIERLVNDAFAAGGFVAG